MKTLRTPDERFTDLPGYPFSPNYADIPDGEGGTLRVHYLDKAQPMLPRSCSCTASRRGATCTAR